MSNTGEEITIKNSNICRLGNTLLKKQITEEIAICIETNENWKHNSPKPMGLSKSSAKGKVHSNTSWPQETRKSQINNLTLHLKATRKGRNEEPQR